jgi:hypothetical protein
MAKVRAADGATWAARKRYSEFDALRAALAEVPLPLSPRGRDHAANVGFPEKRWLGGASDKVKFTGLIHNSQVNPWQFD